MKALLIIFFLLATVLISVATKADERSGLEHSCLSQEEVKRSCLVDVAKQLLVTNDGASAKLDGRIEVSLALHAAGRSNEAEEMLRAAWEQLPHTDKGQLSRLADLSALATASKNTTNIELAQKIADGAVTYGNTLDNSAKKWDLLGKLVSVFVAVGEIQAAQDLVQQMPESDYAYAAYKARSIREAAAQFAKQGAFGEAQTWIRKITMGLPYYQATARTDVAYSAVAASKPAIAEKLAAEAIEMAPSFENGYFVAGALREVGEVYGLADKHERALQYFEKAYSAALLAPSKQEAARAVSRVATGLADHGYYQQAAQYLTKSIEIAESIEADNLRNWTRYEIVGSLAFSGEFDRAKLLLKRVPKERFASTQSLHSAAARDLAWGFARHGQLKDALAQLGEIETAREQVQALARIIRVTFHPDMQALPRYL